MNWFKLNYNKVTSALLIVSVLFAVVYFWKIFSVNSLKFKEIGNIIYVIPAIWVWLLINGNNYYLMLRDIDIHISRKDAIKIWLKSNLSIYTPGKVGLLFTRISYHKKWKHDIDKIGFILVNESLLSILSTISVVFITSIFLLKEKIEVPIYGYSFIIIVILIIMNPFFIKKYQKLYFRLKNAQSDAYHLSYNCMIKIVGINIIKWFFWGLAAWWILNTMSPIAFSDLPYIVFTYCSASLVGLIAFFAPSGIGIIEVYSTELYSLIVPTTIAAVFSIYLRLWKVLGELSILLFLKVIK